jgi:YspA, cpYpsA-related SLOG family
MQQRRQLQRSSSPLRLLVCGSRTWTDSALLASSVEQVVAEHGQDRPGVVLIEGDARGADRLAGEFARARGWELEIYPADWQRHGCAAGMRRNARMLRQGGPERVIAFTDDLAASRGTADMVRRARGAGVPVLVVSHPPATSEGGEAKGANDAAPQLPLA